MSKKGEEAWRLQSQGSPTRMIQGGKMTNHGCASLHNVHPVNYEHPGFAWGVKGAAASFSAVAACWESDCHFS